MSFRFSKIVNDRFFWQTLEYVAQESVIVERVHFKSNWLGVHIAYPQYAYIKEGEAFRLTIPFWRQIETTADSEKICFSRDLKGRWMSQETSAREG
jgi:hypothetical protein